MLRFSIVRRIVLISFIFWGLAGTALADSPRESDQPQPLPGTKTLASSYWEEEDQIRIKLEPGLILIYEGNGWHRERLELMAIDVWDGGVTWSFSYYDRGTLDAVGIDTQTELDACKSVAEWRVPEGKYDDSCDFFISPTQFRELISNNRTFFRDSRDPSDAPIRLENPKATIMHVKYDGRLVKLEAIEAGTTRRERFTILNDPELPLILSTTEGELVLREISHKKRN